MNKLFAIVLIAMFAFTSLTHANSGKTLIPKQKIEEGKILLKKKQAQKLQELKMKKEAKSKPSFSNGTFIVGKDIQPGIYRTRTATSGCYFERLKGFGGSIDDTIVNGFTNSTTIITIEPSDKGFVSKNCSNWTQDLSQITKSKTTFSDGMFFIGTDIDPGTYKNDGGESCYFSRLSGFTGEVEEIISNKYTNDISIITIDSSDKGFKSNGCGTWTKI